MNLRNVLQKPDRLEELEHDDLGFLLGAYSIQTVDTPHVDDSMVKRDEHMVEKALKLPDLHHDFRHEIEVAPITKFSAEDTAHVLGTLRSGLEKLRQHIIGNNNGLTEQHGAILKYKSVKDLIGRIANTGVLGLMGSLYEQIAAIHGAQLGQPT